MGKKLNTFNITKAASHLHLLIHSGLLQENVIVISWLHLKEVISTPRSAKCKATGELEDVWHEVTAVLTWHTKIMFFRTKVVLNTGHVHCQGRC